MFDLRIFESLKKRVDRFPKLYDLDMLLEAWAQTEIGISKAFFNNHPLDIIEKLSCIQYHTYKKILDDSNKENAETRTLKIRLFQTKTTDGSLACSIAIGLNLLNPYELLEEKHIYRAIASLIPGIASIPESFYACSNREKSFLFCYLEIQKLRGKNLTTKDIDLLRKKLPLELKQSIQTLSSSLIFSYNEETIYKNVVQLARELKSKKDLPQVIILFQDQLQDTLNFNIVLARVRKKNEENILQHALLPSSTKLTVQKIITLGAIQGKIKEAVVFSLEIEHFLFLRKNWSIDLNQARGYVVKILEQLFGPFRDYNGGLLSQQSKQLEQIKKGLRAKYDNFSSLMDELFSFHPPSFQALISISLAKQLFSFVITSIKQKKIYHEILITEKRKKDAVFVLLKTTSSKYLKPIIEEINSFQKKASSSAYSYFEFETEHYLCFINLSPQPQINFKSHLEKAIINEKVEINTNKTLTINFQEGDPPSLNPQIAIDQRCRCLGKGLFEGLTRLNFKGIPEPAAASKIKISSCQTVYTFTLRKHFWSNGEEVTAYDFERSWKSAIAPDSNCLRSDLFYIIKNARQVHHGLKPFDALKVKALNEKTLLVELEYPAFYFLHLLSYPIFSPMYKDDQEPRYFNGPFLLNEWKREKVLHLSANPYYWDKKNVQLKDIIISMHKDINLIGNLFENGELDWIGEPFSSSQSISIHQKWKWQKKKVDQFYWIYLNTQFFPLSSAYIRKALACAINRKQVAKILKLKPLCFRTTLKSPYSNKKIYWDGNVDLAQSFFEKGLKELQLSRTDFPPITLYWGFEGEDRLMRLIKQQIESALEIKINLKLLDWKHLSYLLDKREFQASSCFRTSPYFYSRSYLELFRENSNLYNFAEWENTKFKNFLDKALRCNQSEERENFLIKAEQILLDEMPIIPILLPDYQFVLNPNLKKISVSINGDVDFKLIGKKTAKTSGDRNK